MDVHLPATDEIHIYDPNLHVEKAKGNYIWFEKCEKPYFDLIMGYSSTNFGHCNPDIISAVKKASEIYDNIPAFNFRARDELSNKLINHLNRSDHDYQVYYTVGGAKSIDVSLKLAKFHTSKKGVICFDGAFHGYINSLVGVTDKAYFNDNYNLINNSDIYKLPFPDEKVHSSMDNTENQLKEILYKKSDQIGAILIEPVQGASGFRIAHKYFYRLLRDVSKRYNIVLIADEIQMGLGRTGLFYSYQHFDFDPDIITLSKSLAGGYYPLSAIIAKKKYFDKVGKEKPGFDSTFSNNAFGVSVANKVVDILLHDDFIENIKDKSLHFYSQMDNILQSYSFIEHLNIIGMACGIKMKNKKIADAVKKNAFKNGLIIQTAGPSGQYIKIAPSLLITKTELDVAINLFRKSLDNVI